MKLTATAAAPANPRRSEALALEVLGAFTDCFGVIPLSLRDQAIREACRHSRLPYALVSYWVDRLHLAGREDDAAKEEEAGSPMCGITALFPLREGV